LSGPDILRNLPGGFRHLERNRRNDAVAYMRAWASLIEHRTAADETDLLAVGEVEFASA
jgi:hypothetical protein